MVSIVESIFELKTGHVSNIGTQLNPNFKPLCIYASSQNAHEQDEDTGEITKLPDVHPEDLLLAQLGVDGAEEEVEATQELVKVVSRIMIIRNARNIIQSSQAS